VGQDTRLFAYDETGHLIGEYTATGQAIQEHIWLGDIPMAVIDSSGVIASTPTPATLNVDNTDSTFAKTGTWTAQTTPAGFWGSNFLSHSVGNTGDSVTWKINVATTGDYRLYARWVASAANSATANYTIIGGNGTGSQTSTATKTSNSVQSQRTQGGQWVYLGTYHFDKALVAGTQMAVTLRDRTDGIVIADAIHLEQVVTPTVSAQIGYVFADQINTPRVIADASGKVLWKWNGEPFGLSKPNENPSGSGTSFSYNLRFPGQYFDKESNLHYNHHRYYDPSTGKYVSSDPIGLAGGMNPYAYVSGDPVSRIDPFGLETGVTIWQPVGWGESSFGHVSTDINGTTYSFGPGGMTIMPTTDYVKKNSFRDGMEVLIKLTPDQEAALGRCLSAPREKYNFAKNNCGTPVQDCLKQLGIDTGNQTMPVSLGNKLIDMPINDGWKEYTPINPSKGGSAPWAR